MSIKSKSLQAFHISVTSYVATHNKRSWNSDSGDKISQLLTDAKKLDLIDESDVQELTGKPYHEVRDWFMGYAVPKSKLRYKLKKELLRKIEAHI